MADFTAHSMVLTRMAEIEDETAEELRRFRRDLNSPGLGDASPGNLTQAVRVCRLRALALRRMAAEAQRREGAAHG